MVCFIFILSTHNCKWIRYAWFRFIEYHGTFRTTNNNLFIIWSRTRTWSTLCVFRERIDVITTKDHYYFVCIPEKITHVLADGKMGKKSIYCANSQLIESSSALPSLGTLERWYRKLSRRDRQHFLHSYAKNIPKLKNFIELSRNWTYDLFS